MSKPTASDPPAAAPRKRRTKWEGSIYRTAAGWRGALLVTDPTTGRPARRFVSGATAEAVVGKMTRLRSDVSRGTTSAGPRLTTAAYLTGWLDAVRPTVRPSTMRGYACHVRTYWTPAISSVPLARLAPTDVERAMSALTARGVGPVTIRSARTTLRIVARVDAGSSCGSHEIHRRDHDRPRQLGVKACDVPAGAREICGICRSVESASAASVHTTACIAPSANAWPALLLERVPGHQMPTELRPGRTSSTTAVTLTPSNMPGAASTMATWWPRASLS